MLAKRRAASPERGAALGSPTAVRLGREAAEADCYALDLAYRLLNVHVYLLVVVVDPRGIQGAGCV